MRSLRVKILTLAALLVLVTQLGTIGAVLFTANREVAQRADAMLRRGGMVTAQLAAGRGSRLRSAGALLAGDPYFRGAIIGRNMRAVTELLGIHRARTGVDLAILLDADGRVLASADRLEPRRISFPGLSSRARTQGPVRATMRTNDLVYEVVSVPVGDDVPIAWLTTGFSVDGALAKRIGALSGVDVTLLARDDGPPAVLGSSMQPADPARLLGDLAAAGPRSGQPMRITIDGDEKVALLVPFIAGSGDVQVLLTEPLDAAMAPYHAIRKSVLLLSGIALLLVLAGGILLSRTITRPLRELVRAARRIRDGDYRQPVTVQADGEVAELTSALNAMQESIAERETRITYQSRFDQLTGLPTRLSGVERLAGAIRDGQREQTPVAVLLVDLNDFSEIGASLGQDIGDALLCQAAERLRAALDSRHLLARIEGGQFLVVLAGCNLDEAQETAEDLLRLLGAGLSVRDVNVGVEARIGLAGFPTHGSDADQLLQRAAVARNEARSAEAEIRIYAEGSEERTVRQLAVLGDLRRAARHDEFRIYMQPKISLVDGHVCGAEALVRWQHPTFGFLAPDQFIPLAEKSGNISLITNWALAAAVRECRLWLEEGIDIPVSVNLSGRDLQNKNLLYFIRELLRDHDLDPRYLVLEVTEKAVVRDLAHATMVLESLRDLGIRISIDDFGTGYSSLSQLKHLPVDELKIDRSFVTELPDNRDDAAIVRIAIDLAHEFQLEVLAEGVETQPALRWLQAAGCERAQGFLISKPMPAEIFSRWLREYERDETQPSASLPVAS